MREGIPKTRFAPSPSGQLHLGHALAAWTARRLADDLHGECLLRMEDIDSTRCRRAWADEIIQDLAWLGIRFDGEIIYQSSRMQLYAKFLEQLKSQGLVYPCFCSRKQIQQELAEMNSAPQGKRIDLYPGTCRRLSLSQRKKLIDAGVPHAWRLDCQRAASLTGALEWVDLRLGTQVCYPETLGDVVLARKDFPTSYHMAVVIDDALQGVTVVSRGEDLLVCTGIHRLLQEVLHLPVPKWYHHGLVKDERGVRLAKRNDGLSIKILRALGISPEMVREACLGNTVDKLYRFVTMKTGSVKR